MNSDELKGDGFIPCFKGEGDHWSFVRLDDSGKVVEIKEKKRISEYCTLVKTSCGFKNSNFWSKDILDVS